MSPPGPDFRISDSDRSEAVEALGEHMRTGRLTVDEYADRSAKATTAKTRGDLEGLFTDLPQPYPQVLQGRQPARQQPKQPWLLSSAVPIAAVVAIVLFFTVIKAFWVFLLPALVAVLAGTAYRYRTDNR